MTAPSLMVRVLAVLLAGGELLEATPRGQRTKVCGEQHCSLDQYCSAVDHMCRNCSDACEQSSHNYDETTCKNQCYEYKEEKYLLQSRYIDGIQDTVEWLKVAVVSSLSVSCLAVVGLVALVYCLRRHITCPTFLKNEKDLINKKIEVSTIYNNNDEKNKEKNLQLEMPPTGAPSVATTTTPISTRHPSEDATLEYAYDNPNLTPSPQLPQPRHETTF